jgi:hypothetical protein
MKITKISNLNEALAVLNAARRHLNPEHIWVYYEAGGFDVADFAGDGPVEFDRAIGLTLHAAHVANRLLDGMTVTEDLEGRWVIA